MQSKDIYPPQASLLHPSPSSLTNKLCQALPQAASCNYSPMPQTGEMGVRYTLCAELRKTTTVGPLFVNQTQGQNKMLSGAPWVLVIIIENCQTKEHFYWFMYLLIYLFLSSSHFPWSLLGFAAEPVLQSHCLLLNSTLHKSCLVQKSLQGLHMESRTIKSVMCVSGTEMGGRDGFKNTFF